MAMAINKVIVIGNLGANPVGFASLPNSGQNVANFLLATTERFHGSERYASSSVPNGIVWSHSDRLRIRANGS